LEGLGKQVLMIDKRVWTEWRDKKIWAGPKIEKLTRTLRLKKRRGGGTDKNGRMRRGARG